VSLFLSLSVFLSISLSPSNPTLTTNRAHRYSHDSAKNLRNESRTHKGKNVPLLYVENMYWNYTTWLCSFLVSRHTLFPTNHLLNPLKPSGNYIYHLL
jgi:hypothetical protein